MNYTKTFNCGCEILVQNSGAGSIAYCPKHKAAPKMYEALREVRDFFVEYRRATEATEPYPVLDRMNKALAEAEGRWK